MGLKFTDITTGKTDSITFDVEEGSVSLTYYPARAQATETVATLERLGKAITKDAASAIGEIDELLCHLIKEWDVVEDDGITMFPLTPAHIGLLSLTFKTETMRAMMSHALAPSHTSPVRYLN